MNKLLIGVFVVLIGSGVLASTYVNGHYRKNGTYVQGYRRSNSDSSKFNNYSTRGNINPYTNKRGTVDPYRKRNYYRTNQYSY